MYWKMWIIQIYSRVSKRDDRSFSRQFKIHVFDESLFEETPNRSSS